MRSTFTGLTSINCCLGLAAFNDKLVISGGQKGSTTLNHMYMIDFDSGKVEEEAKMKRSRCMHGCVPIDKYG